MKEYEIEFSETMAGYVAVGKTDFIEGHEECWQDKHFFERAKGRKPALTLGDLIDILRETRSEETEMRLVKEVEDLLNWFRQAGKEKG